MIRQREYRDRAGVTRKCKTWSARVTVDGRRRWIALKGIDGRPIRNKRAAEIVYADLLKSLEMVSVGASDPLGAQRARPIKEHLREFDAYLRAKGSSAAHLEDREKCLRSYIAHARAETLAGLDGANAVAFLNHLETKKGLSARTRNRHRAALRQFGRWCVAHTPKRLDSDPFGALPVANEDADRRHVRRGLHEVDIEAFIALAPWHRRVIYVVASETGLRRSELAGLLWRDVDFAGALATVPASLSKNRTDAHLPLSPRAVAGLEALRQAKGDEKPDARVFGGRIKTPKGRGKGLRYGVPNLKTFYADLDRAGIPHPHAEKRSMRRGDFVDLHALARTSLATNAARQGVPLAATQALMRHSTPVLTAKAYTKLQVDDLRAAATRACPAGADGTPWRLSPPLSPPTVTNADIPRLTAPKRRRPSEGEAAGDGRG